MRSIIFSILLSLLLPVTLFGAAPGSADRTWKVGDLDRTGLIVRPADGAKRPDAGWPVVFVFHGHGGSSVQVRRSFHVETSWPDAIVVYLQGLPTVGLLTDPEGKKNGWDMKTPPDTNRDLAFFDAVYKTLADDQTAENKIDAKRVFATGHSNGGGFVYYLWANRADEFAAFAPSAAIAAGRSGMGLSPRPALLIAGKHDDLVKFEWQQKMMARVRQTNHCSDTSKPWGEDGLWYDSTSNTPTVTLIHDGGHVVPPDVGKRVSEFFKNLPIEK